MSTRLVPEETVVAAKRGFLRTSTQALKATIPTAAISGAALSGADWKIVLASLAAAVVSSVLAGAASYLDITSNGIPDDYVAAAA